MTHQRVAASRLLAIGLLLAVLAASLVLAAKPSYASTTFYVNSTEDHADALLTGDQCDTGYIVTRPGGGQEAECTLRAAINQANFTTGADTINFAIPGSGVKTIAPESALPEITEAVSVNGYTQPGASPNAKAVGTDAVLKIELSGANAPSTAVGLRIEAASSTVKGLVINRWHTGMRISGDGASGNKVAGNFVGTDASGANDLGNSVYGILIADASANSIGGATAAERNVISGNDKGGVSIYAGDGDGVANTSGNRVLSNSVYSNGGLGIDLVGTEGATANDPGDADIGANGLQNKPVLSFAKNADGKTTVRGKLNSAPNRTFKIQLFSNPSGTDEGKVFIGQKFVTTDGSGNVTFAFSPAQKVGVGRTITATATSPGGSTSEFSAPRTVVSS